MRQITKLHQPCTYNATLMLSALETLQWWYCYENCHSANVSALHGDSGICNYSKLPSDSAVTEEIRRTQHSLHQRIIILIINIYNIIFFFFFFLIAWHLWEALYPFLFNTDKVCIPSGVLIRNVFKVVHITKLTQLERPWDFQKHSTCSTSGEKTWTGWELFQVNRPRLTDTM